MISLSVLIACARLAAPENFNRPGLSRLHRWQATLPITIGRHESIHCVGQSRWECEGDNRPWKLAQDI